MKKTHSSKRPSSRKAISLLPVGALLTALLVAGCSSVKMQVNNGAVQARSFSFLDPGSRPSPAYAETRKEAHELVQQALINNLANRGLKHVASGGDVTVAYLVVVNDGNTYALTSYFGEAEDATTIAEREHGKLPSEETRGSVEAGTLVVDIVDPKTSKLLQRRSLRAKIMKDLPHAKRAERVQAIVDQALKDVPL